MLWHVVEQVALGEGFLPARQFSPVNTIPPTYRTHFKLNTALTLRKTLQNKEWL
jgi:hypothetical protein